MEHRTCEDARFGRDATKGLPRERAITLSHANFTRSLVAADRGAAEKERVTRREGVHRGTACLAMLRGAMTALASPPSSPPKQPPLSPHPPTLVPSDIPCYSHTPHPSPAPADTAGSTATTHPSLLLVTPRPALTRRGSTTPYRPSQPTVLPQPHQRNIDRAEGRHPGA